MAYANLCSLRANSWISGIVPINIHHKHCQYRVSCVAQNRALHGRRAYLGLAACLLVHHLQSNTDAEAADFSEALKKYVKRKKLDPLETYVPAIILSQLQFEDIEKKLQSDDPKFDDSRSLLRSGPAASLRVNIRAVAQYASESGDGAKASNAVDQCLRALEELDSLLLRASRNDSDASVDSMKERVKIAVGALDRLLQTVPSSVLDKGRAIADAFIEPAETDTVKAEKDKSSNYDPKILKEIL